MKAIDVLVEAASQMEVVDYHSLLRVSSTIDALCVNSREMPFATVKKLQLKLEEIVTVLPEILANLPLTEVSILVQRLVSTSLYLREVSSRTLNLCHIMNSGNVSVKLAD